MVHWRCRDEEVKHHKRLEGVQLLEQTLKPSVSGTHGNDASCTRPPTTKISREHDDVVTAGTAWGEPAQQAAVPKDCLVDRAADESKDKETIPPIKIMRRDPAALTRHTHTTDDSTSQDVESAIEPIYLRLVHFSGEIKKTFILGVDPRINKFLYDLIKYRTGCAGRLPQGVAGKIELLGDHLEDAKDCLKRLQVPDQVICVHVDQGLQPRKLGRRGLMS